MVAHLLRRLAAAVHEDAERIGMGGHAPPSLSAASSVPAASMRKPPTTELFEAGDHLRPAVLEPGREDQRLAGLAFRLVDRLSRAPTRPGDLEQRAARRADIAGLEVVAVLLVRHVGETHAFQMRLEF